MTQRQLPLGAAKRMIRVLIVDQFFGVNPYQLQKFPKTFDALIIECVNQQYPQSIAYHKPEVREVPEDFRPVLGTTVLRAGENGMAELWKYNWDSSGFVTPRLLIAILMCVAFLVILPFFFFGFIMWMNYVGNLICKNAFCQ